MNHTHLPRAVALALAVVSRAALAQNPTAPSRSATSDTLNGEERSVVAAFKGATIREITTRLAQRDMEGRGTAQAGGERAARYIADRFTAWGLKPLGDAGGYLQEIRFVVTRVLPSTRIAAPSGPLRFGDDFVVPSRLPTDSLDAPLAPIKLDVNIIQLTKKELRDLGFTWAPIQQ